MALRARPLLLMLAPRVLLRLSLGRKRGRLLSFNSQARYRGSVPPSEVYEKRLASGDIQEDCAQREVVSALDRL